MDWLLPGLLVVLLVFMFWSSRRRAQQQKKQEAEKANQTVPGAEVLLQGGLYGTIVSYDPVNLDQPAIVELAPGVQIKVHSQAILRVVSPTEDESEESPEEISAAPHVETLDETAARLADEGDTDNGTKPQA